VLPTRLSKELPKFGQQARCQNLSAGREYRCSPPRRRLCIEKQTAIDVYGGMLGNVLHPGGRKPAKAGKGNASVYSPTRACRKSQAGRDGCPARRIAFILRSSTSAVGRCGLMPPSAWVALSSKQAHSARSSHRSASGCHSGSNEFSQSQPRPLQQARQLEPHLISHSEAWRRRCEPRHDHYLAEFRGAFGMVDPG
jgi:hypothetical protein